MLLPLINWAIYRRNSQGADIIASLITRTDLNVALQLVVINVLVIGEWCSALIEFDCSQFVISAEQCQLILSGSLTVSPI